MDVSTILLFTLSCAIVRLFAKFMLRSLRLVARRLLASNYGLAVVCALAYCLPKLSERTVFSTNIILFSMLSTFIVGLAMGVFLAKILQNCVRMDACRTLASSFGFAMVCFLAKILHNYVIRMSVGCVIGNAMGYIIAEILQQLERLYHVYKKYKPNPASLQVQNSMIRFLIIQAQYVRSLDIQARLQAYIYAQHMDAHNQDPELHELSLEAEKLCNDVHKECHEQLHKMCHDLHELCQRYKLCDCTNPCTNLCSTLESRLDEDEVANDSGGNSHGLPGLQEEAAVN